jgi:hypothetical protein
MRRSLNLAALAATILCLGAGLAHAEISKGVQAKLKGQILISPDGLAATGDDDAATIKALKKASTDSLKHEKIGGLATWRFHFMAFMNKKPGATQVALDFYTDDKKKEFVAQKRLAGIDPSLTLLQSSVEITDDDGLSPGKSYLVKLTATIKGKESVLATTKLRTR